MNTPICIGIEKLRASNSPLKTFMVNVTINQNSFYIKPNSYKNCFIGLQMNTLLHEKV